MSNKVTVAAIQMTYGLEEACEKVREAASQGAQIILLPELFENWYFCQEKSYENYHLATTLEENPAVREMQAIARDFKVVIPVSYYERVGETTFNTVAVIDADGTIMGQYRKTHIPDDHFYQEKFYFTPGDTGFKVWDTAYAKIGVGICWQRQMCIRDRASRSGIRLMRKSASVSAGTSGSRNPRAAWHCRVLNCCSTRPPSVPSRFSTAIPCRTGGAACRATRRRTSCRWSRPTALVRKP